MVARIGQLYTGLFAALSLVLAATPITRGEPVIPDFAASNFVPRAPINNPYFPLVPGTVFRESAQVTDPDSGANRFEEDVNTVTFSTKAIAGVQARVVRAQVFFNGVLGEDT